MSAPPFTLDKPRYDQGTWAGRTLHFFSVTNPAFLTATSDQLKVRPCPLSPYSSQFPCLFLPPRPPSNLISSPVSLTPCHIAFTTNPVAIHPTASRNQALEHYFAAGGQRGPRAV